MDCYPYFIEIITQEDSKMIPYVDMYVRIQLEKDTEAEAVGKARYKVSLFCVEANVTCGWHSMSLVNVIPQPSPFCYIVNVASIIAELEGEATSLDAQFAENLYICMFICIHVRHSHIRTPRSWPRNRICSYSYSQELLHLNSRFRLLPSLRCTCGG